MRWIAEGTAKANSVRVTAALDSIARVCEQAVENIHIDSLHYNIDSKNAIDHLDFIQCEYELCAGAFDELSAEISNNACDVINAALKACDTLEDLGFYIWRFQ